MNKIIGINLDFLEKKSNLKKVNYLNDNLYLEGPFLKRFFESTIKNKKYLKIPEIKEKFQKNILINIENIYKNFKIQNQLLAWGSVQSGKTDAIISTAMAFLDNDYDIVIILGGVTNLLYEQTNDRIKKINILDINFLFLNKDNFLNHSLSYELESEKKILINVLKESANLDKLINWFKHSDLFDCKILFIDDESDFGSINIGSPESKIYDQLTKISNRVENIKFLEVTATPYANIISTKSDFLAPQTIIKLQHSDEYTGLDFFEKNNEIYEISNLIENQRNLIKIGMKWYFSSAVCYLYMYGKENFELLINIDLESDHHNEIYQFVYEELQRIKNNIFDSTSFERYLGEYLNYFANKLNISSFLINENIFNIFEKLIFDTKIEILNGNNKNRNKFKTGKSASKIIIGGVLVSRGFTFEKLLTEIMINAPKNKISADTLLQRARWFGYRKTNDWYKFMKIITTKSIKKSYSEVYELNKTIDSFLKDDVINDINIVREEINKTNFLEIISTSEVKKNGK